ncbi:hypothetical protein Mycsm_01755 [Mycobacterium sp. JS623]|uniref:hypothetical protein n=1 Tax=Mycobacterium sp. JS623 TaxID=212767 RepID=UPI0002A58280|nr:hypothetical protein [Mycobacterium sp. JS623]AGB22148.1 hypothetical protein Mycsm_01755 [Mycobacterium sp. JS623]
MTNEDQNDGGRLELCPFWCIGEHDQDDDDASRRHVSRSVLVPGIALIPPQGLNAIGTTDARIDLPGGEQAVGVMLSVVLHGRTGSPLTWVYLGDGGRNGWDISSETTWLLIEAVKELLNELP